MAMFYKFTKICTLGLVTLALGACSGSLSDAGTEAASTSSGGSAGNCAAGTLASAKVTVYGKQFPVCVITQDITSNTFLTNTHIYVLQNTISVGDGGQAGGPSGTKNAVLTLQPGTQVYAVTNALSSLVVTRGSRIEARGTADLPIIMGAVTATGLGAALQITDDPANLNSRGAWGGLVLNGKGINNRCVNGLGGGELATEAAPTGVTRFMGCTDNTDSSGTVEYVIIAESGLLFRPGQEVQGLTIEAAGSNTRINFLQILGSNDDGVEWFGGAASASNVVVNGADDDGIDFDEGTQLTVQNVLVIQGATFGDMGIEADTAGPSNDAEPVSNVHFINVTILGNDGSTAVTAGAHIKVGFGGAFWRTAFLDNTLAGGKFDTGCFDMDNQIDRFTAFRDVAVNCANGTIVPPGFGVASSTPANLAVNFFNGGDDEAGAVSADRRDFTLFAGTINPNTLAVDPGVAPNNTAPLPPSVNGNPIGNYFGAVNPASGNPDGNPNNNGVGGGPFWDGWTYINSLVDGNLPGANFHPLQAEIQSGVINP